MKALLLILVTSSLVSCNTAIGVWRDTKDAYRWSNNKIQEKRGGGQAYQYGAPTY